MTATIFEPARGLEWLRLVLNPLATGGAWLGVAPTTAVAPFIVYWPQSGVDLMVVGPQRVWNDGVYQVKVCGPASAMAQLASVADAVDAALHAQGGVNVGPDGLMLSCTREEAYMLPEGQLVNGQQWLNLVLIYRIYVQSR